MAKSLKTLVKQASYDEIISEYNTADEITLDVVLNAQLITARHYGELRAYYTLIESQLAITSTASKKRDDLLDKLAECGKALAQTERQLSKLSRHYKGVIEFVESCEEIDTENDELRQQLAQSKRPLFASDAMTKMFVALFIYAMALSIMVGGIIAINL